MNALNDQAYEYVLKEFGNKGYDFWKQRIASEPIIVPHPNDPSKEVEISARWDSAKEGPVRVLVSTLHTTRLGIVLPTKSFLVYEDNRIQS